MRGYGELVTFHGARQRLKCRPPRAPYHAGSKQIPQLPADPAWYRENLKSSMPKVTA